MTPKQKIIDDYLKYNLTEQTLDQILSDQNALDEIAVAELSDKLSKEFFSPGYEEYMANKKQHFRSLITSEHNTNNTSAQNKIPSKKQLKLLIGVILIIMCLYLLWSSNQKQGLTIDEVKQYALLSYESTGALDANRGAGNTSNQLSTNYDLLLNEKCREITVNGKYPEQELWSQLYCAYLDKDEEMIDLYKSRIIANKYANYLKL